MKDLEENNLVRFKNISKKSGAIFVNFKVKGLRRGVEFSATISVDISAVDMDAGVSMEKIIERCAKIGMKEFKGADFQYEGISSL